MGDRARGHIRRALWRGVRRRCPHCGQGPLFRGWGDTLEACPVCRLRYERNPGDTWAFTIVGDRVPVAAALILVYFGLFRRSVLVGTIALAALAVTIVTTAPNRWGVGIALHYVSRMYFPDPADPMPPLPDGADWPPGAASG
jgi:uncharacterized protein (DUF983 family)